MYAFLSDDLQTHRPLDVILRKALTPLCILTTALVYHWLGRGRRYYKAITNLIGVAGYAAMGVELFLHGERAVAVLCGVLSVSEIFSLVGEARQRGRSGSDAATPWPAGEK